MALISQSDLEAKLGRSLTGDEVNVFNVLNPATQAIVEELLNVSVESVSESSRYYDGGLHLLNIDLCTNITSVQIVDNDQVVWDTIDTSDWVAEPFNKTLKQALKHRGGRFPRGIRNVLVKAKFSIWEDVNARNIVKNALLDMLVQGIDNKSGIKKESIEGYSVEYSDFEETASMKALHTLLPIAI